MHGYIAFEEWKDLDSSHTYSEEEVGRLTVYPIVVQIVLWLHNAIWKCVLFY